MIAFQQANGGAAGGTATAPSLTFTSSVSANFLIVCSISWTTAGASSVTSTSDSLGSTWHTNNKITQGTRNLVVRWALTTSSGLNTVTFNMSTSVTTPIIGLSAYSLADLSTPFDTIGLGSDPGTLTAATTSAFTPAGAGEAVISHAWSPNGYINPGSNYVTRVLFSQSIIQDRLNAPAGSQTATALQRPGGCCCCVAEPWLIQALVFKPAALGTIDVVSFGADY